MAEKKTNNGREMEKIKGNRQNKNSTRKKLVFSVVDLGFFWLRGGFSKKKFKNFVDVFID